jgi:hypothetical protein
VDVRGVRKLPWAFAAGAILGSVLPAAAGGDEGAAATSFKFTPTYYRTTNARSAYDLNLRANRVAQTGWIGYYRRGDEFQQLRLGYEHALELAAVRLVPSVQYASRGFLGASATAEIGERHFALVGLSRTNLKDYFNLNFDPNDSLLLGAGTRAFARSVLTVYQIKDDRLGTGQHVTHFVLRTSPAASTRWTIDVFTKAGRTADGEWVRGTGATLTYDFGRYFARIAHDPHVNFTPERMLRAAFGWRF